VQLQCARDREDISGVIVDHQHPLAAQDFVTFSLRRLPRPGPGILGALQPGLRLADQGGHMVWLSRGEVKGDALAQFVQRWQQLKRLGAEPEPGQPRLRAVDRVPGVGQHRDVTEFGLFGELLEERERGRVFDAEV
jgi:hypothetical protein